MTRSVDKIITIVLRLCLPLTAFVVPLFFLPVTVDFFGFNKQYLLSVVATICLVCLLLKNIFHGRARLSLTPSTVSLVIFSLIFVISSWLQSSIPTISLLGKTSLILSLVVIFVATTTIEKDTTIFYSTLYALLGSVALIGLFSLASLTGSTTSLPAWATGKDFNLTGGSVPFLTLAFALIPASLYLAIVTKRPAIKSFLLFCCAITLISSIGQVNYLISVKPALIFHLPYLAGWSIALDIFKNWRTALIGTGPETFLNIFPHLKSEYLNLTDMWNIRFNSSSSEILELLTTVGFLGTVFLLRSIYKPVVLVIKEARSKKASPIMLFSALLALASFVAMLIIPAGVVLYFVFFLGLIFLNLSLKAETDSVNDFVINMAAFSPSSENEAKKRSVILPLFFFVLGFFGLIFFWSSAARAYLANITSYQASQTLQKNVTQGYNLQIKAYQLDPYNSVYRVNFSQTSMALANQIAQEKDLSDEDKKNVTQLIQQAIREAKNATELDPDNVLVWENLSRIYQQLIGFVSGSSDWTIAAYSQAISLDPSNPVLRLELGGVYLGLKDLDQAQKLFEVAIALKPNWPNAHYNLAAALKLKKAYQPALAQLQTASKLLDPQSDDAKKIETEIQDLQKLIPPTVTPTPTPTTPAK